VSGLSATRSESIPLQFQNVCTYSVWRHSALSWNGQPIALCSTATKDLMRSTIFITILSALVSPRSNSLPSKSLAEARRLIRNQIRLFESKLDACGHASVLTTSEEGEADPVLINLRKGSYVPEFAERQRPTMPQ